MGRWGLAAVAVWAALAVAVVAVALGRGGYYLGYHAPEGPPKRAMIVTIHGGGWKGDLGPAADQVMATFIDDLQSWGYRVYNLGHRPGRQSLADTIATVDRLRRRYPRRPLCVLGGSSGGHLALMAAIERPDDVDCVVDIGAPIDFIRREDRPGWQGIRDRAAEVFGVRNLREVSPIFRARRIRAAVLVVAPECDYYTSPARQAELVGKLRRARLLVLDAGPGYDLGGHCPVTFEAIELMRETERAFLARNAR
jgi:pimeloyl-ACP methyl ester carboxylesterase